MTMPLALLLRRRLRSSASPLALFGFGEQGVWFDPSDVANLNWRRNISLNSDAETLWQAAGTTPPTVALSQTYLSKTCAAITFAAGTGAGFSVSRADRALTGGTYNITSGTTYVMSYEISFSRALTGSEAIGVLQTGVQGINGFTFNASNTSDLVGAWLRISSPSALATASGTNYPVVNVAGAITASPVTVYVRAIQVEAGSTVTDYQRITDVNTEVIERFPTATLYQDPAGTTPVTTTGQSVGLMLDKSKGLVLGSELITNGDFSGGTTGWVADPGWTITGGGAVAAATGANLTNSFTCVAGRSYRVEFDVISYTSGDLLVAIGANYTGNPRLTSAQMFPGRKSVVAVAGSNLTVGVQFYGGSIAATIDNISVKELPGNHAVQATTANRPIYGIHPVGGRRNLLVRTEEFDNAAWQKLTGGVGVAPVLTSGFTDPDGGSTAWRLQLNAGANGSSDYSLIRQSSGSWPDNGTRSIWIRSNTGASQTVALVATNSSTRVTVTTAWQRFEQATGTGAKQLDVSVGGTGSTGATADILIWHPQFEASATATAYQRVTDQYNVTEAGVSSVSYLFFDGVNDSLATPSINFTSTDKMTVFAGVRKLSDAATGAVLEYGVLGTNLGSFAMHAPNLAIGVQYRWSFFNNSGTMADTSVSTGYAAPISNVLTGSINISGDLVSLRANGAQVSTSTADQGPGNFPAYPIYIGARANVSIPFSGHLYSLIVRGAQSNTGQISSTETWVASKTGITI